MQLLPVRAAADAERWAAKLKAATNIFLAALVALASTACTHGAPVAETLRMPIPVTSPLGVRPQPSAAEPPATHGLSVCPVEEQPVKTGPGSCTTSPAALRYLQQLMAQVRASWQPPSKSQTGKFTAILRFRVDSSGNPTEVCAEPPASHEATAAVDAVYRAAPFGIVPPEAICLTEGPFKAHFVSVVP